MARPSRAYRFQWQDGNAFELLANGDSFLPRMLAEIGRATRFVALEMYLFESGQVATRFIDALIAAVRRGVPVHVVLDGYGSARLLPADRARLHAGGVRLGFYNPFRLTRLRRGFHRDHRKMLVVDGVVAFVGGMGITDDFDAAAGRIAPWWRETVIEIRGPVVRDWCDLFGDVWEQATGGRFAVRLEDRRAAGTTRGRVTANFGRGRREISRSLLKRVRAAERRVWIATPYFVPPRKLRRALRLAARDGVDVRLLLPGPHSDHPGVRRAGHRHYAGLLRQGVRIFEYQPRFMHQKVMLCDDWISIGSSNVDRWGQHWNLEANQEIEDRGFADATAQMLGSDFAVSVAIEYAEWRNRWVGRRMLEWFWGKIDLLVEKLER
jgi:phosphatidylserine/phosphatidylglycerophosphate/cardiolipin synthase-like enzyme